jgi:hypothetical protein
VVGQVEERESRVIQRIIEPFCILESWEPGIPEQGLLMIKQCLQIFTEPRFKKQK